MPVAVHIFKNILDPSDFSDVSRKAVLTGLRLAEKSGAEFHLMHVVDSRDVREDLLEHIPPGSSVRDEINKKATERPGPLCGLLLLTYLHLNDFPT